MPHATSEASEEVLVEPGEITKVVINRPDRRNALTVATTQAISSALERAQENCRVIVLTGAGSAFSAGGDFDELVAFAEKDPEQAALHLYEGFQRMIRTVRLLDVPVIAAINGHAMGAGMDLALACDLRVASENAKLGQVWVRLGIIPGTGGAFWTSLLAGSARAAQMLLSGEPVDAPTAHEWGLVNEVTSEEKVVDRAFELARLITRNPHGAVKANKRALDEVIRSAWESALGHARDVQPQRFASAEFRDALDARRKG